MSFLAHSSLLYTKQPLTPSQSIAEVRTIRIYESTFPRLSCPRLAALKHVLTQLNLPHEVAPMAQGSLFIGQLPILQLDNAFFDKHQFLEILLKISPAASHQTRHALGVCREVVMKAAEYFMWVDQSTPKDYLDPYWLLLNPLKKISHFQNIKQLKLSLEEQGYHSPETVYHKVFPALTHLATLLSSGILAVPDIPALLIYFYLDHLITVCPPDTLAKLSSDFPSLI